jgi:hypothetical protein
MTTENEELRCQLCGKKLNSKSECYEYENYDCLCEDCKENEEQEDDGILFI